MELIFELLRGIGIAFAVILGVASVLFGFKFIRGFDRVGKPALKDGPLSRDGKVVDGYAVSDDTIDVMLNR